MTQPLRRGGRVFAAITFTVGALLAPSAANAFAPSVYGSSTPLSVSAPTTLDQLQIVSGQEVAISFDVSRAGKYKDATRQAFAVWHKHVPELAFTEVTGGRGNITVQYDPGWPFTMTQEPGKASINMGEQAISDGFYDVRVAAHEIGHALGLPDNRDGQCATLMSGHSSPKECKSVDPNPAEIAGVRKAFHLP